MANRLPHPTRQLILRLLCEGNSLRSVSRITGCHVRTIGKLILGFGQACKAFLDDVMQGLTLEHCEVDEVWSYVGKKQARLTVDERAERHDIGDVYLWTVVDQKTKLIPCFVVGKRSADNARKLMMDLASRLEWPNTLPHATDAHAFEPERQIFVTQISTDGFNAYPEAVDLAFGGRAKYGQLIKNYRNAGMDYTPSEMIGAERRGIVGIAERDERTICTSHVERNNGTIRTFIKRFARLTNAFSKKLECHEAAIALFVAYYNFCWRTRHTDYSKKPGKRRPTAAMMAKVTDHLWTFEELYKTVIQYG
jgi:IS1 family transposase